MNRNHKTYIATSVPDTLNRHFDVIVIGSGAGGATAAARLSGAGLKVLILEEGPYRTSQDFTLRESDAYPDLYQDLAARKTHSGGVTLLQGRTVGGSTTVNWTASFRTPEEVLQHWQREFGLSDLTSEAMMPWFELIEQQLSIQPWQIPPNQNNALLKTGCDKVGIKSGVISRNVSGCANLGYCGLGCPINAKQSMLVTRIPEALDAGAVLVSRARVQRLNIDKHLFKSLDVQPMDESGKPVAGRSIRFTAEQLVLAAGAIASPGLLLRSNFPDPYQQIGKRTFIHPVVASAAIMPEAVNAYQGAPQSIYSDHFLWRDGVRGELGYKLEVPPLHPLITSALVPGHGQAHRTIMTQFDHLQVTIALLRDGFHPEDQGGQVLLDNQNREVLDYPLKGLFWRAAEHALKTMAEIQFAAGAKQLLMVHQRSHLVNSLEAYLQSLTDSTLTEHSLGVFSAHLMGGCGMSDRPERGLVDNGGRAFAVENLRIMDGSVLPTSLGVNPQLTLYALASRNTEQMLADIGAG